MRGLIPLGEVMDVQSSFPEFLGKSWMSRVPLMDVQSSSHFKPKGKIQKRISFLFHGVHHQYPNDKKRLVMPITLSLAVAVLLLSLTWLLYGTWTWAYSAGFTVGYLAYDMTHYSIHYFKPPNIQFLKNVWKSHIDHHYRDSTKGYGVSSAFWDRVFGTLQKPKKPLKTA